MPLLLNVKSKMCSLIISKFYDLTAAKKKYIKKSNGLENKVEIFYCAVYLIFVYFTERWPNKTGNFIFL